ncbi:MAG: radical SAM protein [Desulfobacterales bacterium SG8_35_2]|nr:MAG: radical SAM protein [Desulfobacterales bacterium SG8_35_2]
MNYEGNIIRPPSEAHSIILQVTVGCSHNKCTFCGAYKEVQFRIKDTATINNDVAFASRYCTNQKRVFLADGDVLIIPTARLVGIFSTIRQKMPWVNRISLYGNTKSILRKTVEELQNLKELGLDRIYMGLESGHNPTLKNIKKGVDVQQMIQAAEMVRAAGLFLSVTVLLGIAGRSQSLEHARETGRVLSKMKPNQIAALTLMLLENTPLFDDFRSGSFQLPDQKMLLAELKILVESIALERVQFQANHASNYLPISGRLSKDKEIILQLIEKALKGGLLLKEEYQRTL